MNAWLLSVIGIVFLGVLFDLIYPNGKTNTLTKSIFGIFAIFIMISPLLRVDLDEIISQVSNQEVMINSIIDAKNNSYELKVIDHLVKCNIEGVSVEIEGNMEDDDYIVENVYIDSSNLVLTENITNINKYEVITKEVANIIDVEPERIVIYG